MRVRDLMAVFSGEVIVEVPSEPVCYFRPVRMRDGDWVMADEFFTDTIDYGRVGDREVASASVDHVAGFGMCLIVTLKEEG